MVWFSFYPNPDFMSKKLFVDYTNKCKNVAKNVGISIHPVGPFHLMYHMYFAS